MSDYESPGSPCAPPPRRPTKKTRPSPAPSPGGSPALSPLLNGSPAPSGAGPAPPALVLPPPTNDKAAPVPPSPPAGPGSKLFSDTAQIGVDESYSNDEKALNEFLKLHPVRMRIGSHS